MGDPLTGSWAFGSLFRRLLFGPILAFGGQRAACVFLFFPRLQLIRFSTTVVFVAGCWQPISDIVVHVFVVLIIARALQFWFLSSQGFHQILLLGSLSMVSAVRSPFSTAYGCCRYAGGVRCAQPRP